MSLSVTRPYIGIVPDYDPERRRSIAGRAYAEALSAAGGLPLILPYPSDPETCKALMQTLDGLLLTGSKFDVDPSRYGEAPHPALGPVCAARDTQDLLWLQYAYQRRIPILAICYGCQVLNVFRGGTLFQDLAAQKPDALPHRVIARAHEPVHDIVLVRESRFYHHMELPRTRVNSTHHQAVKDLAIDFQPAAWSPDGVLEAFESRDNGHWVMGIQWHPESIWQAEPVSRELFHLFVAAALDSRPAPVTEGPSHR